MTDRDLAFTPAYQQAKLIAEKRLSPVELVKLYLDRIEELDPKLNSFLTVVPDQAMAAARAAEEKVMDGGGLEPLHGVPIGIKDLQTTAGIRTTFGSLVFKDFIPENDSVVVERVRNSGAIILGKTNVPEFGFSDGTTENRLRDACRNPWDTSRTTGSSSGGSAAAVAAGLCPLATGSDGGGSIRTPPSYCGIYGIKPTFGRVPEDGEVARPAPNLMSQPGPIARTVRDAAVLLQALAGPDDRDPIALRERPPDYLARLNEGIEGMRVAWSPDLGYAAVDPEVKTVTSEAAKAFEELGAIVEEPRIELEPHRFHSMVLARSFAAYGYLLDDHWDELTSSMRDWVAAGKDVSGADCVSALHYQQDLKAQIGSLMETYDLILTPVSPLPAFPIDQPPDTIAGRPIGPDVGTNPFNVVFSLTGQPAASVPCGFTSDGLPIGLHVVGRWGDEAAVLRASAAFEQLRPWARELPPVS